MQVLRDGRIRYLASAVLAAALVFTACSSGGDDNVVERQVESNTDAGGDAGEGSDSAANTTPREGADSPADVSAENQLPSVEVDDLAGGKVDLASFVDGTKPIVIWAWAPH